MWATLSGVSEPVGALFGYLVLGGDVSNMAYGSMFGIVAGMMVYISLAELLPSAYRFEKNPAVVTASMVSCLFSFFSCVYSCLRVSLACIRAFFRSLSNILPRLACILYSFLRILSSLAHLSLPPPRPLDWHVCTAHYRWMKREGKIRRR